MTMELSYNYVVLLQSVDKLAFLTNPSQISVKIKYFILSKKYVRDVLQMWATLPLPKAQMPAVPLKSR